MITTLVSLLPVMEDVGKAKYPTQEIVGGGLLPRTTTYDDTTLLGTDGRAC